jgi:hypothetical protein
MITEQEAERIVSGIQTGSLDALDVVGIVGHYEEWVKDSWSYTASLIREEREMEEAE